jgi:hypothetical protein
MKGADETRIPSRPTGGSLERSSFYARFHGTSLALAKPYRTQAGQQIAAYLTIFVVIHPTINAVAILNSQSGKRLARQTAA